MLQRTVQILNVPRWLTVEQIQQAFSSYNIKEVKVPTDNIGRQFGVVFASFENYKDRDQFLSDISKKNKYLYLS